MRRAIDVIPAGRWPSRQALSSITLGFDDRFRRRIRLTDDRGEPLLLDLKEATQLADGDGLVLEGGGVLRVRAADEPVVDIYVKDAAHAAKLAWHLGNRHTPVQILASGTLRIRDDHVLVAMVEKQGAKVIRHAAPFSPEAGAYHGEGGGHGHHHHHGDDHHHHHSAEDHANGHRHAIDD